jgi:glutathione S-transferase
MILFGSTESGHSYKVRLFLLLAQIEHEYRCVDLDIPREARPADFRAAWETNRVGFSVPNLRHALRWEPQPESVLKFLRERANVDLKTLNDSLAQSDFLVPSGLTIADLSCAGYLYWIDQAGLSLVEFPHVQHWLRSIAAVNGWQSPSEAMQPQ